MYPDFIFLMAGILLICLERDIGWCVEINQLSLVYGIGVGGLFIFG